MNRKQRRAQKPDKPNAIDHVRAAQAAMKQGRYGYAIDHFAEAMRLEPANRDYKIQLCNLLRNIQFQKFSVGAKKIILKLLSAKGLDYQCLWQPWFSILMIDPDFQAFQDLVRGKDINPDAKMDFVDDPYFIAGINNFLGLDYDFERALQALKQKIDASEIQAKEFNKAFSRYCERNEYLTGDVPDNDNPYPIDDSITTLSDPNSDTSRLVQDQYEANPYPRWENVMVPTPTKAMLQQTHDHLIAGCGTGYAACGTALLYPNANIVALDLSRASLSYAQNKAKELGLKNITFFQADILNLEALDKTFDVIECSGVLHHMKEPFSGWKSLKEKLKQKGKMHIGLYSELGRGDVIAARDFITEKKFDAIREDIIEAREAIASLSGDHPARGVLKRRDFYSTSSCRDLLFHEMEHRFTIPQIEKHLKDLDLTFSGFNLENPQIAAQYRAAYPADKNMTNLQNWAEFEQKSPDIFRGMYQFWCVSGH